MDIDNIALAAGFVPYSIDINPPTVGYECSKEALKKFVALIVADHSAYQRTWAETQEKALQQGKEKRTLGLIFPWV